MYAAKITASRRSRLGITVSRRIGKAVVRNRVKRRIRECFRLRMRPLMPPGTWVVVIARRGAAELEGAAMNRELVAATLKLKGRLEDKRRD